MKPVVSILMPVKNTAPYLKECIDSIINQTYYNWELLAVDDHSVDNSIELLRAFAKKDPRIKVLQNNNNGIVAALETAYEIATGIFVTRMDSDDINELHKYESMVRALGQGGVGHIAIGQVKYFSASEVGEGFQKYEQWLNGLISKGNCFNDIYKECSVPSPCWMLYKEDLERIGGLASQYIPEDYDLAFRMYKAGLKCIPSQEVLLNWRDSDSRTSRTHPDYTNEKMLALKCHYFLDIDFDKNKNVVLWGAGNRGKFIAKYLVEKEIAFTWVCNNEKKIGHDIYGVILRSVKELFDISNKQIVVSVANNEERLLISEECRREEWESYFFC